MVKRLRVSVIVLSLMLMGAGVGCVAASKCITLAKVDKSAVEYVVEAGVAEPNDFIGWPNLLKVEKLEKSVDSAHKINRLELEQAIEAEDLEYSIHKDVVKEDKIAGLDREEAMFGEKGLLSLGLSLAGFGSLTGVVGLMRKRPGDVTSQELEQAVVQATGKTNGALSEKEKQLVDVVKGIQKFMNTYKDTSDNKEAVMLKELKIALDAKQDTNTQVAVAKIKKEIA